MHFARLLFSRAHTQKKDYYLLSELFHWKTSLKGHERLVQALSDMYSQLINRKIDPFTEILITCGAYEALYSAIRGFVLCMIYSTKWIRTSHQIDCDFNDFSNSNIEQGDEVILIEPSFDSYEPLVKSSGGVPRFIPLRLVNRNSFIKSLTS